MTDRVSAADAALLQAAATVLQMAMQDKGPTMRRSLGLSRGEVRRDPIGAVRKVRDRLAAQTT